MTQPNRGYFERRNQEGRMQLDPVDSEEPVIELERRYSERNPDLPDSHPTLSGVKGAPVPSKVTPEQRRRYRGRK